MKSAGRPYEKTVGLSWRVDGTYIKVSGEWTYLYRAVDSDGRTVDFFLSKRRDLHAAKVLFRHALHKHGDPLSITLDAYALLIGGKTGFKRKVPLFRLTLEEGREVDLGLAGKVGNSHIHRVFR